MDGETSKNMVDNSSDIRREKHMDHLNPIPRPAVAREILHRK